MKYNVNEHVLTVLAISSLLDDHFEKTVSPLAKIHMHINSAIDEIKCEWTRFDCPSLTVLAISSLLDDHFEKTGVCVGGSSSSFCAENTWNKTKAKKKQTVKSENMQYSILAMKPFHNIILHKEI